MYAFTNWIYSGRKLFEFFVKKIKNIAKSWKKIENIV